jgi:A/G-specific adenine glycosylase
MRKGIRSDHSFSEALLQWHYHINKRQMPWKGEKDPYKIWLSEIILQQTRVAQGLPYYLKFIENYPTLKLLAGANDADVFKLWEGLGYYSRCRNLLAGARQLMENFDGVFPASYEDILNIKGVGPYTAAAIGSFAFNLPYAVVDGNVTRLLARYFGIYTAFDTSIGKKQFAALAQQLLVDEVPAAYNQAIMDFGASVCTPADPLCDQCVFNDNCVAYKTKATRELPVRSKKLVKKKRWLTYFIITCQNKTLVRQRHSKDIWHSLHEFYLVENQSDPDWSSNELMNALQAFSAAEITITSHSEVYSQQLTHQTIYARFFEVTVQHLDQVPTGYQWISAEEQSKLAFPRIINSYLNRAAVQPLLLF